MPTAKFENIPYIRPDYKQYARNIELCAQGIRNADTMETLRRELEEFWDYRTHVETMEEVLLITLCKCPCLKQGSQTDE